MSGDFKAMTERLRYAVREAVYDSAKAAILEAEAEAKKTCPIAGWRLRNSITHQVADTGDEMVAQVGTNVSYAAAVEFGTKPHFPPVSAIEHWVHLKGLASSPAEEKSIAFAIARKIAARGTVGKYYLTAGIWKAKNSVGKYLKSFVQKVRV
jgi:phage gpG-like protein